VSFYFLDSSALIKRYVVESGSTWVHSITSPEASNLVFVAQISQVEIVSGVMRRKRERAISAQSAHTTRFLVDRHMARQYEIVALTQQIIDASNDLLDMYALRAYDSVQLASALSMNSQLQARRLPVLAFISADIRLLAAASDEGLAVDDPNLHS
jgi:predicted nucleic acid-binding protein